MNIEEMIANGEEKKEFMYKSEKNMQESFKNNALKLVPDTLRPYTDYVDGYLVVEAPNCNPIRCKTGLPEDGIISPWEVLEYTAETSLVTTQYRSWDIEIALAYANGLFLHP